MENKLRVNTVLIIDFVTDYFVCNSRKVEVSYKIVNMLNNNTRIVSFVYYPKSDLYYPKSLDDIYQPSSGYALLTNGHFFREFPVIITRGYANKNFIKQFVDDQNTTVFDILSDIIPTSQFIYQMHPRPWRLTQSIMMAWQDSSRCKASVCRNVHYNGFRENCSFKNVKCMLDWLNNPIF